MLSQGAELDEKWMTVFTETPELCADSLVFLTKERREWLTGRYINCTWDLPELEEMKERVVNENLLTLALALP